MADTLNSFPIETRSWPDFTTHDDIQDSDLIMARRGSTTSPLTGVGLKSEIDQQITAITDGIYGVNNYNSIINPRFNINQEVVSGTVTLSSGEYGHDGWKGGSSGCTYTFSSSGGLTSIDITSGTLLQVVKSNRIDAGINYLNWSGTSQGRINSGSYGLSGAVQSSLSGTADITVEFNVGTLSNPKLEEGVFTGFEYKSFTQDLEECQKYYRKSYQYTDSASSITDVGQQMYTSATAGAQQQVSFSFPTMASIPVVTLFSPSTGTSGQIRNASAGGDNVASAINIGDSSFVVEKASNHADAQVYIFHYEADARP